MDRSLPMRGTKTPNSPHSSIIPESSRFGLVALAVTLLFLWIALTEQTILRLHPSNHTRLRSGGLNLGTLTTGVPERRGLSSGSDLDDWLLLRCNTMFGNGSSAAYVARCACLDR